MSPETAAELFLEVAKSGPSESNTAWRLWNLVFHAAASLPKFNDDIVQLTLAIRRLPRSPESPNTLNYNLWPDWRDAYGFYQTWKALDGTKSDLSPDSLTGAERWINFTTFSAKLVQQGDDCFARECGIYGFFVLRDALETTLETHASTLLRTSVVTAEDSLSDDTEAAAQWVIHAGIKLHDLDNEFFGEAWNNGLGKNTELWDGQAGFSPARWRFWSKQFYSRAEQTWMSDSAKKAADAASRVIQTFL